MPLTYLKIPLALIGLMAILPSANSFTAPQQKEDWKAPERAAKKKNPVAADEKSLAAGKAVYTQNCLSCHGGGGKGDGPAAKDLPQKVGDLAAARVTANTDGALFWKITEGRAPMPTYEKLLSEEQRWQVIVYVRSITSSASNAAAASLPQFAVLETTRQAISSTLAAYSTMQAALAREDQVAAKAAALLFITSTDALPNLAGDLADEDAAKAWGLAREMLQRSARALKDAADLAALRAGFHAGSDALIDLVAKFGHHEAAPVELFSCAKAFDGAGAQWLQISGEALNPYMPAKTAGVVKLDKTLAAKAAQKKKD